MHNVNHSTSNNLCVCIWLRSQEANCGQTKLIKSKNLLKGDEMHLLNLFARSHSFSFSSFSLSLSHTHTYKEMSHERGGWLSGRWMGETMKINGVCVFLTTDSLKCVYVFVCVCVQQITSISC